MTVLYIAGGGGHAARIVSILEREMFSPGLVACSNNKDYSYFESFMDHGKLWGVAPITKPNPLGVGRLAQVRRWFQAVRDSLKIMRIWHPEVIVAGCSNVCLVPCLIGKIFGSRIFIVESFVEVEKPAKTTRILDRLRIADTVLVEWDFQKAWFRNPVNVGLLIPEQGSSGLNDGDETYPSMKLMKALAEGRRVFVRPREDLPLGKQERFIEFLQSLGWIDENYISDGRYFPSGGKVSPKETHSKGRVSETEVS